MAGAFDLSEAGVTRADQLVAAKRAIPISRMVDYGLPADDAAQLHALDADRGDDWQAACEAIAERHLRAAAHHADAGLAAMATLERERAAAAYNIGQLAIYRDDDLKRRLYDRATACLASNAAYPGCDYRRLQVRGEAGRNLYGWVFDVVDPIGTVVLFGGLSGWGASFMGVARALNRQRIGVILAEAPGQGETRMLSALHLSRATLAEAMRFVDAAAIGGRPVGLVGFSFGGLIAAHLAAAASDVAALCTNGSPVAIGALNHPAEREQFAAAFGAEGDALLSKVGDFGFDAGTQTIRCPVLALEGGADPLVPVGTWRGFVGTREDDVTTLVWEDGLHTLYNHAADRNATIAAWISDCFRKVLDR